MSLKNLRLALFVLAGVFIFHVLPAQVWSPPGAVWNYNITTSTSEGCETRTYIGDSVISGRIAQQIHSTGYVMNYLFNELHTIDSYSYQSADSGIVRSWISTSNEWDTLYWFSAVPGDRWWPPGIDPFCGGNWGMWEVSDTATMQISGYDLRSLTVRPLDEFGVPQENEQRTILERLGVIEGSLAYVACIIAEDGYSLRSYLDYAFPIFDTGETSLCENFLGGIQNAELISSLVVFPNPGSDQLNINWSVLQDAPVQIGIYSMLGELLRSETASVSPITLQTHDLPAGCYSIRLIGDDGSSSVKWLKQ